MTTNAQSQAAEHTAHHVTPLKTYVGVYGALLVLTVLTVGVSYANLGAASIYAAMAVAIVKAALVVGFFMHLLHDARFNAIVFLVSLLFLVLFFAFTMVDVATRDRLSVVEGNFVLKQDRAAASAKAAETPPAASSSSPPAASAPAGP